MKNLPLIEITGVDRYGDEYIFTIIDDLNAGIKIEMIADDYYIKKVKYLFGEY